MRKTLMIILLLVSSGTQSAFSSDSLFFIGIDKKGNNLEVPVNQNDFNHQMDKAIGIISEPALNSLDRLKTKKGDLKLDRVDIGTYIKMSLGLGNIIKGTIEPYLKLFLKKN